MTSDIQTTQFTKLYIDESDSVYRFCLLRTSDKEAALDIMQDTFMHFWDAWSREKGAIRNKRAFLFAIARNRIIDWYRKKKTLSIEALTEGSEADIEAFADVAGREEIEMGHEARSLLEKIREIDPLCQQAVYFRFVEGLGPKDIAQILGESANVVSVRIHRGLRQLKKIAGYDEPHD